MLTIIISTITIILLYFKIYQLLIHIIKKRFMKKIEICRIVEDCLKLKKGSINENTKSSDVEEWDSLGQISIVMFLDKKYNDITKDNPTYMTSSSITDFYEAGLKNVDYIE